MTAREHPAATLRRAAEKMRHLAGAATQGPWAHMCLGSEGCLVLRANGTPRERTRGRVARFGQKDWQADHADAAFTASWNPLVAEAVAAWLEETAKAAEAYIVSPGTPSCAHDEACACDPSPEFGCEQCAGWFPSACRCWDAALAVARAYLGEEAAP